MKRFNPFSDSRGAVAPLVAIMLVVIIVCVALVVDLGHIHNVKVQLQRAVDAAALAGAQQLDGSAGEAQAAKDSAVAVAAANRVDQDNVLIVADAPIPGHPFNHKFVQLGTWDDEALGDLASSRFAATETSPNAVKVTAARDVEHVFFWFLDSTKVVTDAIAVNQFKPLTIPISVVTCIPTGGGTFPGVFSPAQGVCDLALFKFGPATTDTAGWTSLTIPVAANPTVSDFFSDCGIDLFNRIVYGGEQNDGGLENTNIVRSLTGGAGCPIESNETDIKGSPDYCSVPVNISCGLGGAFEDGHNNPPDPRQFAPLPHWYDDDGEALERIWSQEGTLSTGTGEVDANGKATTAYFDRLKDLYRASDTTDPSYTFDQYNIDYPNKTVPPGIQDSRFTRYIQPSSGKPDFRAPLEESGYPEVALIEGKTAVIKAMVDLVANEGTNVFKEDIRDVNEPLDNLATSGGSGETVLLTIPIIYTGSCESTQYNKTGIYVGTANILLTRLWETKKVDNAFDSGFNSVSVTPTWPTLCDANLFGPDKKVNRLPPLDGNQLRRVTGFDGKTFEGLLLVPNRGPETNTGIRKIYLVE